MTSLNFEWLFYKIYTFFTEGIRVAPSSGLVSTLVVIFSIIAIIFIVIIIYSLIRINERRALDSHAFHEKVHSANKKEIEDRDNKRWQSVLNFITSNNPSDWRIAVIEADNMLDDLSKELGLVGDNLGERLKNAPNSHFKTLDNAWEAHKVRNKIAHEGIGFELEYREAKKAIELYENVFREFGHI